jgi:hypothetical protein
MVSSMQSNNCKTSVCLIMKLIYQLLFIHPCNSSLPARRIIRVYYGGQKNVSSQFRLFKKKNCKPYFIVIMITVLIIIGIFWVVNFKTRNYFVIFYYTDVYLRLSMYDCSNFVHSCRIFGISEL